MTTVHDQCQSDPSSPDEVLALLREEAQLYAKLQASAQRQRSLVTADNMTPLLALLADRQQLSVDLARIGTRLASTRHNWPDYRKKLTARQLTEADKLVSDIGNRLRAVIESDEEDGRMLAARKQAASKMLRSTHAAGEALAAYRAPTDVRARIGQMDEAL